MIVLQYSDKDSCAGGENNNKTRSYNLEICMWRVGGVSRTARGLHERRSVECSKDSDSNGVKFELLSLALASGHARESHVRFGL